MSNKKVKEINKFIYLSEDDSIRVENLHLNTKFYPLKRFFIDITMFSSGFKNIEQIFKDLFNLSYKQDYINPRYLIKLKVLIFHQNSFLNSFKKLIKNDFSSLSNVAEHNPKIYIILKLLYEINIESLTKFINSFQEDKINCFELIYFFKEIYIPFLYIGLVKWDVQDKLKISTNFNAKSTSGEIANNILYALSVLTKYCRVKFSHDPGFSSHLFIDMMDSINFILNNFLEIFSPLVFRLLGYQKYSIKKDRKFIDKKLSIFFNISSNDLIEEEEKIVTQKNQVEANNEEEKIILIPQEFKTSALLINYLLGLEFYQDQIRYPDYIGEIITKGFVNISRYKIINNQDPLNYGLAYLSLLQIFFYEIDPELFEDSALIEIISNSLKLLGELQSQVDYFYIKNLIEVRRLLDQNEKAMEQEYVKKMVDELNIFKKQYFFKNYFFIHFTGLINLNPQLTPIYEIIQNVYNEIERILSLSERRGQQKDKGENPFYKWLESPISFKNEMLSDRFEQIFIKKGGYDPKTRRNYLFILFNLLKLGLWSFSSESSFFNSYPTLGFIKPTETGVAKLNVIESAEFYIYNRLQIELDKFKTLAYVDNLTGCYNKNFLQHQLLDDAANQCKYIVLFIDLDNFKYFNDNYSHQTGDIILKEFGKILIKNTRDSDIPIRIGGDEFVVLLKSNAIETAIYFSKRVFEGVIALNDYLSSLIKIQFSKQLDTFVYFSIGVVPCEGDIENSIKYADNLMYSAKKSGKNAIAFNDNGKINILRFKGENNEKQN